MKIEYLKGGNVVAFSSVRRDQKFRAISQIESYWLALRNGRLVPARRDIDPRGMADQLKHAFILEKIAPGLARIRLAGQHLNDVLNMEVRGMPITAFFLPEARHEMQRVMDNLMDMPAQVMLDLKGEAGMFKGELDAQMVLLPLKDDNGQITRALGALQVNGDLPRGPIRFSIRHVEIEPLLTDLPAKQSANATQTYDETHDALLRKVSRVDQRPDASKKPASGHVFRESDLQGRPAFVGFGDLSHQFTSAPLKKGLKAEKKEDQSKQRLHLRLVKPD